MSDDTEARDGLLAGLAAYAMWGFLPLYFIAVAAVSPLEVLAHRIVWAVPFGALILSLRSQWSEVSTALRERRTFSWLFASASLIGVNWLIYIWAIQDHRILETSLGYYINPLLHVVIGVLALGERLFPLQRLAVGLAAVGVGYLTLQSGVLPWVGLSLAGTFACYAVIRKLAAVCAMPGLFIETLILLPLALGWLGVLLARDAAAIANAGNGLAFWLMMAGPITAMPLLCFAIAARRLTLTTIGFMQFLAPTLQFAIGVYYGEALSAAHLVCFGFIWAAVGVFSFDAAQRGRQSRLASRRRTAAASSSRE